MNTENTAITALIYRYLDASVPPQYHRSYEVWMDRHKIRLRVERYGEVLSNVELPAPAQLMATLTQALHQYRIHATPPSTQNAGSSIITGNGTHFLTAYHHQQILFSGCSVPQTDMDTLTGEIDSLAEVIKQSIPNFSHYLKLTP